MKTEERTGWLLIGITVAVFYAYTYHFWRWVDVAAPPGYVLNIIPVDFTAFIKAAISTTITVSPLFWLYKKKYGGDRV